MTSLTIFPLEVLFFTLSVLYIEVLGQSISSLTITMKLHSPCKHHEWLLRDALLQMQSLSFPVCNYNCLCSSLSWEERDRKLGRYSAHAGNLLHSGCAVPVLALAWRKWVLLVSLVSWGMIILPNELNTWVAWMPWVLRGSWSALWRNLPAYWQPRWTGCGCLGRPCCMLWEWCYILHQDISFKF